jgi:ribosomal protein S18 acetylase RimI-like enzyme
MKWMKVLMNKAAKDILIRDFRRSDLNSVLELGRLCFAREFELMGFDVEHLRKKVEQFFGFTGRFLLFLLRVFGKEPLRFFVAEVDGNVVGTTMVSRQGKVGYISTVMVHPDYRGRGIAKTLLERAVNYIRKSGMEKAVLHVDSINETAKNLYVKLGFKEFEKMAYLVGDVNNVSFRPEFKGEVHIRNFQRSDIDSVYELVKSSEDYEHLKVFGFEKKDLKGPVLARLFNIFDETKNVVTFKDKVIGYVNILHTTATEAGQISHICVDPEMRSMGIEELLISAGINAARNFGAKKILATVSLRRQELISAMRHCGFEEKFVVDGMVLEIA